MSDMRAVVKPVKDEAGDVRAQPVCRVARRVNRHRPATESNGA